MNENAYKIFKLALNVPETLLVLFITDSATVGFTVLNQFTISKKFLS
jgi:hypothetical protein